MQYFPPFFPTNSPPLAFFVAFSDNPDCAARQTRTVVREQRNWRRIMAPSSHASSRQHAFTLVELLVVIAIIGTLVALLLPAVQSARSTARTTQCASQMGEIAKGLIAYQTNKGNFPGYAQYVKRGQNLWATADYPLNPSEPRVYVTSIDDRDKAVPFSWAAMILRNIERQDIWDQIIDQNFKPEIPLIEVYRCPSDTEAAEVADRAALSYNVNTGAWDLNDSGRFLAGTDKGDVAANGVFFDLAKQDRYKVKRILTRLSGIRDGAATTILVSENRDKTYDPDNPLAEPNFTWLYGNEQQVGLVWVVPPDANPPLPTLQEAINRNTDDVVVFPANFPRFARPASDHGGGVNVAFCDGHVQLLDENIDYIVYQQLMTTNGAKCEDPQMHEPNIADASPAIQAFRLAPPLSEADLN
jgi:prepilin-type N-terminal cleavage/methylation domain-containing protein/prepilin-type processing-associated H-X9-DG protein